MLSGVLDDYKEAEKIPADIVCALDSLSEKVTYTAWAVKKALHKKREEGGKVEEEWEEFSSEEIHKELKLYTECLCVHCPARPPLILRGRSFLPLPAHWHALLTPPNFFFSSSLHSQAGVFRQEAQLPRHDGHHHLAVPLAVREVWLRG